MTPPLDQLQRIVERYLAAGVSVLVVLLSPDAAGRPGTGGAREPAVVTVEPGGDGTGDEPARDDEAAPDDEPARDRDAGGDTTVHRPRVLEGRAGDPTGTPYPTPADTADPAPAGTAGSTTSAAAVHGWGTPDRVDEFDDGTGQWSIYDGPGHGGNGRRSPEAVSVAGGVLTLTGDGSGTTAGMAWSPGRKYGRWEARVRAPAADPSYHALLLLWPDAEDFPEGGEIDFMEMTDGDRQETDLFVHYGADDSQVHDAVRVDGTQWHNWAVEWTPDAITAYVDGQEWFRTTDPQVQPPGPMHLCVQLDWFPRDGSPRESTMQVDWVRQYALDGG